MPVLEAQTRQASSNSVAVAQSIMRRLEDAWNAADGAAFGEPFSSDADFVAIRGDLHTGRQAIAEGHQQILHTIYANSTIRYEVLRARELDERILLAHVRCTLIAPTGPLAGENSSMITLVLAKQDDEYEIAARSTTRRSPTECA